MTTEQPYIPSEDLIIEAWKRYSGAQDVKYARLSDGDAGDEARRFIAQVGRDAARDALDELAAWMSDLHDKYPSHAWYVPLSLDNITRYTTDNYPEETP